MEPFTSSCPSIVFRGEQPEIVLGAPGGTQIAMGVLQAIVNVVDHGMNMHEAVSAPALLFDQQHHRHLQPHPAPGVEAAAGAGLRGGPLGYTIGWVHAIRIVGDRLEGGADPGRDGVAYEA